jgi:uncharacterized protein (DUF58 family)
MVREFEETPDDNLVIILDGWLSADLERERGRLGDRETRSQAEERMDDKVIPSIGVSPSPLQPLSPSPPPGSARQRLEDAISLAASIFWEWCQESGNRIVLGVADKNPQVIAGESGPELRSRLLRALAGVSGDSKADVVQLAASIRPSLPPGPILVLTTSPGNLQSAIEWEFHRPVTCIQVTDLARFDFFEW